MESLASPFICTTTQIHHGLPLWWAVAVFVIMAIATVVSLPDTAPTTNTIFLGARFLRKPWLLVGLRSVFAAIFVLVVVAGLWGTPIPERNLATVLTWTIWWTLVIVSVVVVGTGWCAVCPWDTIAGWLVKRRLWGEDDDATRLKLRVPRYLRTTWPALVLLIGLTWLELGVGVTMDPEATAMLALVMVVLAVISLAMFERKALCRYFCPVGRTIGAYAQLAPVALRPLDLDACHRCTTLECYHGSGLIESCPTHLTLGRLSQNTYCTSCGNCAMSCPTGNVSWRLRTMGVEASTAARPHWDEAWFMVSLLSLTVFHGLTMTPLWETGLVELARMIGDSSRLLVSFTIGFTLCLVVPVAAFTVAVTLSRKRFTGSFRKLLSSLAFAVLPVAFADHLAHNLVHLSRDGGTLWSVLGNPFGVGALPLSAIERQVLHLHPLIPEPLMFALQAGLMAGGYWLAVNILRQRGRTLGLVGWSLVPMLGFLGGMTVLNVWLLMQDMVMRV